MTTTRWNRKDLLGLRELSVDEINLVEGAGVARENAR